MHNKETRQQEQHALERLGSYVLTPFTRADDAGRFAASVSIRRGMHDRVFRFIPRFSTPAKALRYALAEGRQLVLSNQLG